MNFDKMNVLRICLKSGSALWLILTMENPNRICYFEGGTQCVQKIERQKGESAVKRMIGIALSLVTALSLFGFMLAGAFCLPKQEIVFTALPAGGEAAGYVQPQRSDPYDLLWENTAQHILKQDKSTPTHSKAGFFPFLRFAACPWLQQSAMLQILNARALLPEQPASQQQHLWQRNPATMRAIPPPSTAFARTGRKSTAG